MSIKPTDFISNQLLTSILLALTFSIVGAILYYWITKLKLKWKLNSRFSKAFKGEVSAQDLLAKEGYTLSASQKVSSLNMWVNGEMHNYKVRPDAFATKDDQKYLVEIKTGKQATNPTFSATRRQLLEYFHGFDVDGVLLVDADLQKIHHIYFDAKTISETIETIKVEKSKRGLILAFILGFMAALFIIGLCQ